MYFKNGEKVKVIFDYIANSNHIPNFKKGDILTVKTCELQQNGMYNALIGGYFTPPEYYVSFEGGDGRTWKAKRFELLNNKMEVSK